MYSLRSLENAFPDAGANLILPGPPFVKQGFVRRCGGWRGGSDYFSVVYLLLGGTGLGGVTENFVLRSSMFFLSRLAQIETKYLV